MKDTDSIPVVEALHPKVREQFKAFIEDAENSLGITIRIVQGFRTFEQQQAIYNRGRTIPGPIVTWSPPGSSYHNYGLAADVCPFNVNRSDLDWDFDFNKFLPFSDKHGLQAGLRFPSGKKDDDHFENKCGYNWRELLDKYHRKDFIEGSEYVNL